jgi:hypothetical protein
MPIQNDSDLQRIRNDLAKAKRKLSESEGGAHIYGAASGIPTELAGIAHGANVKNLYALIERLENEYVNAMLAERQWTAAGVIAAMQRP